MPKKNYEQLMDDIAKLEQQQKQLEERKKQLKARANNEQRKRDTHMKVTVGAHVVSLFEPFDMSNEKVDKDAFYNDLNDYINRFVESRRPESADGVNSYERFGQMVYSKLVNAFGRNLNTEEIDAFVNGYMTEQKSWIVKYCRKKENQ